MNSNRALGPGTPKGKDKVLIGEFVQLGPGIYCRLANHTGIKDKVMRGIRTIGAWNIGWLTIQEGQSNEGNSSGIEAG